MKLALLSFRRRAVTTTLALCLLPGFAVRSQTVDKKSVPAPTTVRVEVVTTTLQPGVRLLETELIPSRVTLLTARCEHLIIAVGKTTLAHPADTLSILHAALTRGVVKKKGHGEGEAEALLPCTCARQIFLASVAAAPRRVSDILDLATLLYPDCTPEFAEALQAYDSGIRTGQGTGDPSGSTDFNSPMGVSISGGDNDTGGFGVGFGPGFPGSPGFTGSGPSGGIALPPGALTSVVNG